MFKYQHSFFNVLHKGTQQILYLYKGCCVFYFSWLFVTMVRIIKHFRKPDFLGYVKHCPVTHQQILPHAKFAKITVSITKSTHQDCDLCYFQLPIFFLHTLSSPVVKYYCDHCSPQQIRPQTTVQIYILQDYSSVRIGVTKNI